MFFPTSTDRWDLVETHPCDAPWCMNTHILLPSMTKRSSCGLISVWSCSWLNIYEGCNKLQMPIYLPCL